MVGWEYPTNPREASGLDPEAVHAHVRNPMYVGVLLVVVGNAIRYRSVSVLWWAAGCWIGFHNRIIRYEEPHLVEKHGEAYERYCETVPRWLPRLRPPKSD